MQQVRERGELHTGFWWRDLREREHLEDPGIDERIMLKWIFKKWDGVWTGFIWLKIGTGCYECCNEISGSTKCREFLD